MTTETATVTISREALQNLTDIAAQFLRDWRQDYKDSPEPDDHTDADQLGSDIATAYRALETTATPDPVLATLAAITARIDSASGSPHFTADEHGTFEDILRAAGWAGTPPAETEPAKAAPTCSECGSDDIRWDAWADHNGDTVSVLDYYRCEGCGEEQPPLDHALS